MSRRSFRRGLDTTTISVKLTTDELIALDGERTRYESAYYSGWSESRGDALRRLITAAAERRAAAAPPAPDPRQEVLPDVESYLSPAADKTEQLDEKTELLSKTEPRPLGVRPRAAALRKTRAHVRKTKGPLKKASSRRARTNSAIRR